MKKFATVSRKKSYTILVVGVVLFIVGLVLSLITKGDYETSKEIEDKALKLSLQRPYSYSLALVFLSILLTARGIYNAVVGIRPETKTDVRKLAQASLLAALSYVGFAFLKFDITVPGGSTAIHFGNVFVVLAALLLGGYWGGLAGAVGLTIADLTTAYVTSAPKTFLLKLMIGLIVGFVAHTIFKLDRDHTKSYVLKVTIGAGVCGMLFNVVADPLVGYFYKMYLLGIPQDLAATFAKINAAATAVNAVFAVAFSTLLYLALRPALKRTGLLVQISPEKEKKSEETADTTETTDDAADGSAKNVVTEENTEKN